MRARLLALFDDDFPALRGRVSRLENGPPVGFPVQFRVSGEDIGKVRAIAREVADVMRADPDTVERAVRLGRADEGRPPRDRPEQGAGARHLVAGPRHVPQQLGVRRHRDQLPRGRQADRRRAARRPRGARRSCPRSRTSRSRRGTARRCRSRRSPRSATSRRRASSGGATGCRRSPCAPTVEGDAQGPDVTSRIDPRLDAAPRRAAARLPDRDGRRDRGLDDGAEVDRRRRAAARRRAC